MVAHKRSEVESCPLFGAAAKYRRGRNREEKVTTRATRREMGLEGRLQMQK